MSHARTAISNFLAITLLAIAQIAGLAALNSAPAQERVMLILDSSGSMWGQVEGVNKHLIARDVIGEVLSDIGENVNMGVMAYGHRRKGDCRDIETLIPVGPIDPDGIMSRIKRIQPRGKTPITAAVRRAGEELKYSEEKATIVLVSDGLETCDADPCALATEMEKVGVDFTVHVVGFDLGNEDVATLKCLAENTGGVFLQAGSANELTQALGQVVENVGQPVTEPEPVAEAETEPEPVAEAEPQTEPEPEPEVGPTLALPRAYLAEGGEPLDDAYFRVYEVEQDASGERKQVTYGGGRPKFELAPGMYHITAKHGAVVAGIDVEIEEGKQNVVEIVLDAGIVRPVAYLADGVQPLSDAYFRVYEGPGDGETDRTQITYGGGKPVFTVPAGTQRITAKRGDAIAGTDVTVVAGEVHRVHVLLNAGLIVPKALWTEGGDAVKDAYFRVFETAQDANGKRKQVTYGGGDPQFTVAAGEYYITAKVGDTEVAQTIAVSPGETTEVTLVMGAGVLAPSAAYTEGGEPVKDAYFRVYENEEAADGNRKQVTYGGGTPQFKLPAGTYYITAKTGDTTVGQTVEVKSGERTEVTLVLNAGVLIPTAMYSEGGDPIKDAYFRVYEAEESADGKRKQVTYGGGTPKFKLPAGTYYVTAEIGKAKAAKTVEVKGGEPTEVAIVLGAGVLVPKAYYTEGGDEVKKAYFRVFEAEEGTDGKRKQVENAGGNPRFKLEAGKYYVTAEIGKAVVGQEVEVLAGEPTEVSLVINSGVLALFAAPAEGADPVNKVYFRVYENKKSIDGNRKQVDASGGKPKFNLPGGTYFVTAAWGKALASDTVEVKPGELTEVTLNLNAGRITVVALDENGQPVTKGGYYRVYEAKKDIEGNRTQVSAGGGKSHEVSLPAGDYVVEVNYGGRNKVAGSQEVTVTAGELSELKVQIKTAK